ncbi:sugar porter (SP) family MFS transporter [Allomyces macrogynus ATCC 38327]|uniref:Sugar porter (SP) family MFS transporter n=1 Tax=Allomyces macrogynus (strain ATCC 38327) TaxID=578462 RepID=A0A0L0SJ10_ALLM3|nr:sugar porter (SP) family MFS transporter [Allomyces macrogynus ATCC 38327]|eukprot:KNE62473.1 sugar porter (SP) family MFS transporter [Allomyces macrogynus ATCC 38327]
MVQWYSWFVSFTAALGGFLFGYEIGIINSVLEMDQFRVFFGMSDLGSDMTTLTDTASAKDYKAQITSFFLLGCIPGALFIAVAADYLGRKKSIWLGSLLFSVGALIQALVAAESVPARVHTIMAGRFIGGSGVGILSMSVPLYIAEMAPTDMRGRLTSVQQLMITIGIAVASIINAIIIGAFDGAPKDDNKPWRLALGIQAGPGFLLFLMLFFLPESPRWLMFRDREAEALTNLAKLRQSAESSPAVQEEYQEYKDSIEAERQIGTASWSELRRPGIFNRLVLGVVLQFFQQWTGINAVMYYSSSLFIGMGIPKATATTVNVVVQALVNVLFTLPGMYLIERAGRKKLLVWGGLGMAAFMWGLVLFVNLFASNLPVAVADIKEGMEIPGNAKTFSILAAICMYCYVACFASTWGPVVWVYQSEIFPLRIRGKGTGIATASNWINNFILSYVWPYAEALGANQYIVFGTTGLAMAAFVQFFVPETKGKSLEHMDEVFGFTSNEAADLKA